VATRQIAAYAVDHAPPLSRVLTVAPPHGPEGIDSVLDTTLAAVEVVREIVRAGDDHDACVIACGVDPGLAAARQVSSRPVVGIAEAGMLAACLVGHRFVIPVLSRAQVGVMSDLARAYGFEHRVAAVPSVGTTAAAHFSDAEAVFPALRQAAEAALETAGGDCVVLTGAAMAGLERPLQDALGVPVICGLSAGLELAGMLGRLDLRTSRLGRYATPGKADELNGYDDLQGVYSSAAIDDR
jgi:allantoin racemase